MFKNWGYYAQWPAPKNVHALCTSRAKGYSLPPYQSNNLALHVGDCEEHVRLNRKSLRHELSLPNEPVWLEQTHSTDCIVAEEQTTRLADAAVTRDKQLPLVIMTADCLPITLCNQAGTEIAAIHAGWRGLVQGIIENTLNKMQSNPSELLAWIGPAICQSCYETGPEVVESFIKHYPFTQTSFRMDNGRHYADLPQMAELILKAQGVNAVYQSTICTFEQESTCYSYRRNAQTGRMATLIWFNATN